MESNLCHQDAQSLDSLLRATTIKLQQNLKALFTHLLSISYLKEKNIYGSNVKEQHYNEQY